MNERQKRLIEVYDHLRRYYGIHTKSGFAEAIHYGRTSMSAAMNGVDGYLTDNLFKNICEAYPGVFNLNYLLNGDGDLLTIEEDVHTQDIENQISPAALDMSFIFEKAIDKITASNDKTIASMEAQVAKLEDIIKTKDKLIHILELRIRDLEFAIETTKIDYDREKFPSHMSNFALEPPIPKKGDV